MKRLLAAFALMLVWSVSWADSPLTSTHFSDAYSDHPMVQMANEMMQNDIPTTLLNFLSDKKSPVDVRLAVINKIGWNFDGTTMGQQLGEYLMGRYKANNENSRNWLYHSDWRARREEACRGGNNRIITNHALAGRKAQNE